MSNAPFCSDTEKQATEAERKTREEAAKIEKEKRRAERRVRDIEQNKDNSRIPEPILERIPFDSFEVLPGNEEGFEAAKEFCFNEDRDYWFLTLCGTPGTGKTHLAQDILIYELNSGRVCQYWQVADLLDYLRSSYDDKNKRYTDSMNNIKDTGVLVLDDLGAEKMTEWAQEKLTQLIDYRYREYLDTIITTNCEPSELPSRISSRLQEGEVARLTCTDYRLLIAKRRSLKNNKKMSRTAR